MSACAYGCAWNCHPAFVLLKLTWMQINSFPSNVMWHIDFAHSAYCTFKGIFFKVCTVFFFLLNGSAASFCCYLCAEHFIIPRCLKFKCIISQHGNKSRKKAVFCLCSLKYKWPFCRTAAMSFAKMEGISGLNTLAVISGFCLCRFIFFKKAFD